MEETAIESGLLTLSVRIEQTKELYDMLCEFKRFEKQGKEFYGKYSAAETKELGAIHRRYLLRRIGELAAGAGYDFLAGKFT